MKTVFHFVSDCIGVLCELSEFEKYVLYATIRLNNYCWWSMCADISWGAMQSNSESGNCLLCSWIQCCHLVVQLWLFFAVACSIWYCVSCTDIFVNAMWQLLYILWKACCLNLDPFEIIYADLLLYLSLWRTDGCLWSVFVLWAL